METRAGGDLGEANLDHLIDPLPRADIPGAITLDFAGEISLDPPEPPTE